MKVATGKVVSIRYNMKNNRGDVLEDIMDKTPVDYLHGAGNMLPALEAKLEGLESGVHLSITISPETSPDLNDSFHFDIIIDNVRAATEEEIREGKPLQMVSKDCCSPDCCC